MEIASPDEDGIEWDWHLLLPWFGELHVAWTQRSNNKDVRDRGANMARLLLVRTRKEGDVAMEDDAERS